MNIIEQATEILRKPIGWLELDISFDLPIWQEETKLVKDYFVDHREDGGHKGWRSCCIHGISVDKTGHWQKYANAENEIEYQWTSLSEITPTITKFWKEFPCEKFARLRFMELEPGGFVMPHCDAPNGIKNTEFDMMDHIIPINVAISHPEGCYMDIENHGKVPWSEGKAFIVNITNTHAVYNPTPLFRTHLIAHCIIGNKKEEFAELVVKSYNKQYEHSQV